MDCKDNPQKHAIAKCSRLLLSLAKAINEKDLQNYNNLLKLYDKSCINLAINSDETSALLLIKKLLINHADQIFN